MLVGEVDYCSCFSEETNFERIVLFEATAEPFSNVVRVVFEDPENQGQKCEVTLIWDDLEAHQRVYGISRPVCKVGFWGLVQKYLTISHSPISKEEHQEWCSF